MLSDTHAMHMFADETKQVFSSLNKLNHYN